MEEKKILQGEAFMCSLMLFTVWYKQKANGLSLSLSTCTCLSLFLCLTRLHLILLLILNIWLFCKCFFQQQKFITENTENSFLVILCLLFSYFWYSLEECVWLAQYNLSISKDSKLVNINFKLSNNQTLHITGSYVGRCKLFKTAVNWIGNSMKFSSMWVAQRLIEWNILKYNFYVFFVHMKALLSLQLM